MSTIRGILTTSVPVPLWFALMMVVALLGMNWCVREQLRLVRWFYEQRPGVRSTFTTKWANPPADSIGEKADAN